MEGKEDKHPGAPKYTLQKSISIYPEINNHLFRSSVIDSTNEESVLGLTIHLVLTSDQFTLLTFVFFC